MKKFYLVKMVVSDYGAGAHIEEHEEGTAFKFDKTVRKATVALTRKQAEVIAEAYTQEAMTWTQIR